jgi:hypothetical protein
MMRLAQRELERGQPDRALAWCDKLGPIAAKMTEGSEGAITGALEAIGRAARRPVDGDERLEAALTRLRDVDAKGMLAYVLAAAAEIDREAGRRARARERAVEAVAAAEVVGRRTLVAWARASLAQLAMDGRDVREARAHLGAITPDLKKPMGISARARIRVDRAFARVECAIVRAEP